MMDSAADFTDFIKESIIFISVLIVLHFIFIPPKSKNKIKLLIIKTRYILTPKSLLLNICCPTTDIANAGPEHIIHGRIFLASFSVIIFLSTIELSIFAPIGYPATIDIIKVKGRIIFLFSVHNKPELTIIKQIQHSGKREGIILLPQIIMAFSTDSFTSPENSIRKTEKVEVIAKIIIFFIFFTVKLYELHARNFHIKL